MLYHLHVWGQERCIQGFGEESRGIKDNFEEPKRGWDFNMKMDLQETGWKWLGINCSDSV